MAQLIGYVNPKLDLLTVGGHIVVGFADDDMVSIERSEDVTAPLVGTKGELSLVQNLNDVGTMTVRLQETSPSNHVFWQALKAVEQGRLKNIFTYTSVRNGGASSLKGGLCWIQGQPTMGYGSDVGIYEWTFGISTASSGLDDVEGVVEQLAAAI